MSPIEQSAEHLFAFFQQALPRQQKGKPATEKAVAEALERFVAETKVERARRRLGIIGRARLALHLQKRLMAAGYPAQLVRQVVFSLLVSALVGH
jgi:ABC-type uncharacterized transport system YnjBCD ATPase subunit